MRITTSPPSRFGWEGTTLEYTVKADGATELRVPQQSIPGVEASITNMQRTADGVQAHVKLDVRDPSFV